MAFKARPPPTFNPSSSDYNTYSDWRREFQDYATVTTFFDDTVELPIQQARLNNLAGPDFAKFVRQNLAVTDTTTTNEILDAVEKSLKPKRFDLQNREKLFSHRQSNSSAAKYLDELRELYSLSNYGETVTKESLIRDLFIAGITSNDAKCMIFQQDSDTLTLDRCLHLVSSYESVNGPVNITQSSTGISVNSINDTSSRRQGWRCYGCGSSTQHPRTNCPAYKTTCHKCGKIGHFSKVCKSSNPTPRRSVNAVNSAESYEESTINLVQVNSITEKKNRKTISVTINGKFVPSTLVDSGSDITVLSKKLCNKIGLPYGKVTSPPKAYGANGTSINLVGRISNACIETKDGYLLDTVWIAEHLNSDAILGHSSLAAFKALNINYGGNLPTLHVQEINTTGKSLNFAYCEPVSCFPIRPETPIRAPSRWQTPEDRAFLKAETQRLLLEGKIQPSKSPWRSQAFVVRGKKPRMVIDYAQTVNRVTPLDAYPIPLIADLLD